MPGPQNDRLDAAVIAEFTATQTAEPLLPADPAREELAGLIEARRLFVDKRADFDPKSLKSYAEVSGGEKDELQMFVRAWSREWERFCKYGLLIRPEY